MVENGTTHTELEQSYTFIIQTGSNIPAKTNTKKWDDGTMILTINPGSKTNQSKTLRVKSLFPSETEGAVTMDFWLPASVGTPKLLKVDLESNKTEIKKDALYVREITVLYNKEPYRFPIKNFVYPHNPLFGNPENAEMGCPPHFLVREGAGTLKHQETEDYIIKAREDDLEMIHSMVQWNTPEQNPSKLLYPGFLGIMEYDNLPRFLKFRQAKLDAFVELRNQGMSEVKSNVLENLKDKLLCTYQEERFESLEEYGTFLKKKADELKWSKETVLESLKVAQIYRKDEEFGRQMLCGPNPLEIRRVTDSDSWWSRSTVPEHALEGKSIEAALEGGRLFEVTCSQLEDIPHGGGFSKKLTGTKQKWYVVLADCLLYLRDDEELVPVLIRLENRNDGEPETYWTPPEPELTSLDHPRHLAWLYAKMWFRCADVNLYSLCTHFARAHATNEIFAVACYRNLPNAHPVFRLLQPHIQGIIPVNVQARSVLVNPGQNAFSLFLSAGDNLMSVFNNFYKDFSYEDLVLPLDFKKRGVEDLPGYLSRDDMMVYWESISEYVTEMLGLSYPSDEDIVQDTELQNVFADVVDNGFKGYSDGAGFPREVTERAKLVEYLTAVIVNISVFHTAVNFQTFTSFTFPPNVPTCISSPPPKQDEQVTMDYILKSLPVKEIAFIAANISYNLGQYSPIERFFLGSAPDDRAGILGENMAVSPGQEACVRRLEDKMRAFKTKIDERNVGKFIKYDVLSPINTPLTTQT